MNEDQESVEEDNNDDVSSPCSSIREDRNADGDEPGYREEGSEDTFHIHGEESDCRSGDSVVHRPVE